MTALSRATTTTEAPACSAATGGGNCLSCKAEERLGVQPKLHISPPGDRWEQEADRIADQVVADRPAALTGPLQVTPLVQRQPIEEEEEELQPKLAVQRQPIEEEEEELLQPKRASGRAGAGQRGSRSPRSGKAAGPVRAPDEAATALSAGGRPLTAAERAYFEPRFGRDFSAVRIHDGAYAGAAATDIGARAYTVGRSIAFAPGQYAPATRQGRRLMAHELAHTAQQGAAAIPANAVQRVDDENDGAEPAEAAASGPQQIPFDEFYITAAPTAGGSAISTGQFPIDGLAEFQEPFFPGDLIHLKVRTDSDDLTETIDWALSGSDLEIAERVGNGAIRLRVVDDPATRESPRSAEATVSSPQFEGPVTIGFNLEPMPQQPEVHDQDLVEQEAEIEELKERRRTERRDARSERRAGRKESRAIRRGTRKSLRDLRREQREAGAEAPEERREQRAARRELRQGGKEELRGHRREQTRQRSERSEQRKGTRRELGTAREDLATYDETARLSRHRQGLIEAAIVRGAEKAGNAISKISPGSTPNDQVASVLEDYFKIEVRPGNTDQVRGTLQRIVDVLSLARNSMLSSDFGDYVSSNDCRDITGAYVSVLARGTEVTVCEAWFGGDLDFGITTGVSDAQAFALLHEFVHLSGITYSGGLSCQGAKEVYNHCGEWAQVTPEEAPTLADAYTATAWKISGGGRK